MIVVGYRAAIFNLLLLVFCPAPLDAWGNAKQRLKVSKPTAENLDYDCIIIGAGASGLFASGVSSMLGSKTLMLDILWKEEVFDGQEQNNNNLGGDCTNFTCVPSKALRSAAKSRDDFRVAQLHTASVVSKVRARENPTALVERNPNLDLMLVSECKFASPNQVEVSLPCEFFSSVRSFEGNVDCVDNHIGSQKFTFTSKKFLIATGASPIVPESIRKQAMKANLPLFTYRTFYRDTWQTDSIWNILTKTEEPKVAIIGGGGTALEIGQSLARLKKDSGTVSVSMVAPKILKDHRGDDNLRSAAIQILENDGVELFLGAYLEEIQPDKSMRLSDGTILPAMDAVIMCVGRKPTLKGLQLDKADVAFDENFGVLVNSKLRSSTNHRVYACGDCCSTVLGNDRTAAHAAWTGYHAAANTKVPSFLRFGFQNASHKVVPSVIYTDPELVSVGMTRDQCQEQYGRNGFDSILVREENTDRADMESKERLTIGFVELRATKIYGKILGMTACSPAASELANEVSLAIVNRLTVRDMAKSLHSYPSYGYLMYRAALALTMQSIWGSLEALGPVGGFLANVGRLCSSVMMRIRSKVKIFYKFFRKT